jgi:hypothetical protein
MLYKRKVIILINKFLKMTAPVNVLHPDYVPATNENANNA